jgi:hypothetical protein
MSVIEYNYEKYHILSKSECWYGSDPWTITREALLKIAKNMLPSIITKFSGLLNIGLIRTLVHTN